jgi:GMP synthase (glutamine-hydrolysing)
MDRCIYFGHDPIMVKSNTSVEEIEALNVKGIIITGSEKSVLNFDGPKVDIDIYNLQMPILGICYGIQRMAIDLGGEVHRFPTTEKGICKMVLNKDYYSDLHKGFTLKGVDVWMGHTCQVTKEPNGFSIVGSTSETSISAMEKDNLYGVQYHPEKGGHGSGKQILGNFFDICENFNG